MAYSPKHYNTQPQIVEPSVLSCPPMAKASGGGTYGLKCPWDNAELVWAEGLVTTAAATESLVITITDGTTTAGTITLTTGHGIGTNTEWSKSNAVVFARGTEIVFTTTDSANAGAAAPVLYFERSR